LQTAATPTTKQQQQQQQQHKHDNATAHQTPNHTAEGAEILDPGEPLNMKRGHAYIQRLLENNLKKEWPPAPTLKLMQTDRRLPSALPLPSPPDWKNYAPEPPRTVVSLAM
jgi:hypothetical protein